MFILLWSVLLIFTCYFSSLSFPLPFLFFYKKYTFSIQRACCAFFPYCCVRYVPSLNLVIYFLFYSYFLFMIYAQHYSTCDLLYYLDQQCSNAAQLVILPPCLCTSSFQLKYKHLQLLLLNCTESFFFLNIYSSFFSSRYLHSKLVFVHFLQSFPALCLFILWVLQTTFQVCHNKVRDTLCVTADLFSRRLVILPTNLSLTTKILHFLLFHFYVIFALKIEEKLSQWFPLTYFFLP